MPSTKPSADVDRRRAIALGGLATVLYLFTAPGVPNLDGLGYLKLLPHNFAAGHLLYMPLLRAATRLCGGDGLRAGRLANALLAGSGVVLAYGIVRRLVGNAGLLAPDARFAATFAAAGLALSFGYWVQGADVEAYAAAIVALLSTVRLALAHRVRPTLPRALAVGVMLGVAVLCHLTHVLLSVFVAASLWHFAAPGKKLLHAAAALATGGALSLGMYAYAALLVRRHDLVGALRWVGTAAHGFHDGGGPYRVADATYGLAKAVIYSPYLYEADAPKMLGQFLLGLAPLVALCVAARLRPRVLPQIEWRLGAAWVLPYALVGVAFFGSDSERWLFVLPALWLLAGALVAPRYRRLQLAAWILVYVGALNLVTGILPAHRDTWTRRRAEVAASLFHDGDLLVFPGHSWDEYLSFYAAAKLTPFPIAYYAGRDGVDACWERLEREVAAAMMRGGQVYAVRLFDERDEDPRGIKELEQLGLTRAGLRARLVDGLRPTALHPIEGLTVVRLDPVSPP
jgi:hypothetical protein